MSSSAELEVTYKIGNAPVQLFPFPHIYVRDIFPREYYAEMMQNLPRTGQLKPIEEGRQLKGYPERFVLTLDKESVAALPEPQRGFWGGMVNWMVGTRFASLVLNKFAPVIEPRLKAFGNPPWLDEALLVEDRTRYSLGPHTDNPRKLVSLLFYLPKDESLARHGTSIYVPKDLSFTCPGGPAYPFERFEKMMTMPFVPNSLFAFAKCDNAFHGVEPIIDAEVRRHLLLYDIRLKAPEAAPAPPAPASKGPQVRFGF